MMINGDDDGGDSDDVGGNNDCGDAIRDIVSDNYRRSCCSFL